MSNNIINNCIYKLHLKRIAIIFGTHFLAALALLYPSIEGLLLLIIFHFLTGCIGISLCFHRLLTHKAFIASKTFKYISAFLGVLSFHGGPISWATVHRAHHFYSDKPGDAHSAAKGFWWSHILWIFVKKPNGFRFSSEIKKVEDLCNDTYLQFLEKNFLLINLTFNILLLFLFIAISRVDLFLWSVPLRIVLVWHHTYLVNSYAHGRRPIELHSRQAKPENSLFVALVAYGEGYHANHHDNPSSADFRSNIYDLDIGYWVLNFLSRLGVIKLHNKIIFISNSTRISYKRNKPNQGTKIKISLPAKKVR